MAPTSRSSSVASDPHPEPSADLGVQGPFPGEADERLADRSAAHPELPRDVGIADAAAWGDGAALNALQQVEIDLIPEGCP